MSEQTNPVLSPELKVILIGHSRENLSQVQASILTQSPYPQNSPLQAYLKLEAGKRLHVKLCLSSGLDPNRTF
jgi:hypothetical protein